MKLLKYSAMVLAQFAGMALLTYVMFNSLYISDFLYSACAWALWPAAGLVSAYMVTVRGVNNYLAWLSPPAAGILAHYLAFFYLPSSAGPFLICAVCSVVGAAAGDVRKKSDRKR